MLFEYSVHNNKGILDFHSDENIYLNVYEKEGETFNQFRMRMYYKSFTEDSLKILNESYHEEKRKMATFNEKYCKSKHKLFDLLNECCDWHNRPYKTNILFDTIRWIRYDGNEKWFVAETENNLYECCWQGS